MAKLGMMWLRKRMSKVSLLMIVKWRCSKYNVEVCGDRLWARMMLAMNECQMFMVGVGKKFCGVLGYQW